MSVIANHMHQWEHSSQLPPIYDRDLLVCRKGSNDVRRVRFSPENYSWRYVDCWHPAQNVVVDTSEIYAWRLPDQR